MKDASERITRPAEARRAEPLDSGSRYKIRGVLATDISGRESQGQLPAYRHLQKL